MYPFSTLQATRILLRPCPRFFGRSQTKDTTARTFLADDGFFYLEFADDLEGEPNGWRFRIKQCVARLFEGNLALEIGDVYECDHFWHYFQNEPELVSEFQSAGFAVAEIEFAKGYAVLSLPGLGP